MHNAFQYTILQIFTGKYKKMITFVAQKKLFTSVFHLTMKKILTYICAGALVLSTFSCAKAPWNFTPDNRKVAPMTPAQVADNLNETGVAVLNETDPDLWKEWGQTGLKLMDQFYNEIDVEDAFDEFYEDLMEVMSAVTEQDTYKIVTTTIKLSQVKGDFTVSEGELVYTKSDNPFNLTFLYNDKTYVLKLEARDSNNQIMVNQRVDDYNKKKVYNILDVPSMAAIHVTENGNLYLDLVTYPIVNDVDKDGKLGNNDTIEGSATLQIPGYKLELNSLKVSEDGGSARVAFYHNNKRVLAVDGGVELDFASQKENVKAVTRIFRVVDDTEFNILLADGRRAEAGQTGEIVIDIRDGKPCGLVKEYFRNKEATDEVMRDGYYHTGDTAYRDEDGNFWYVGRVDDLIKSSGYRIGPFEIESVIMELPYVLECAVTGVPDPLRGQVVKASVVLVKGKEGTEELKKEIQNYVKEHTAPYKYPRVVEFLDEMPKTISGKIRRVELRERQ